MWRVVLLSVVLVLAGTTTAAAEHSSDDFDQQVADAGTIEDDGDERVLRIHGDEDDDGEVAEIDENQVIEIEQQDQADEQNDEEVEPLEFITGYVEWEFIPVLQVTHTEGATADVDAQQTIEADEEAIADCFEPTTYPGGGILDVELHLSYNGIVQAVNGSADGIEPAQARCMLERAWRYEFPRIAAQADEPSQINYRIEMVGQTIGAPPTERAHPQLLLERVRTGEPELDEAVAAAMLGNLDDVERCAADTLDELPTDFVATEVHGHWQRDDGEYRPSLLDITVHNKTSSELASADLVNCYERALRGWRFDVDGDELDDAGELPNDLEMSFWITVRPAGWHGM